MKNKMKNKMKEKITKQNSINEPKKDIEIQKKEREVVKIVDNRNM